MNPSKFYILGYNLAMQNTSKEVLEVFAKNQNYKYLEMGYNNGFGDRIAMLNKAERIEEVFR